MKHNQHLGAAQTFLHSGDFRCGQCRAWVSTNPLLSGVQNRNHCPYCLHSRHVDLLRGGDRLCACKALMRPIGLSVKRSRDKYAAHSNGELMLIHQCNECGGLSINRIAADDDPQALLGIFDQSAHLPTALQQQILEQGIHLLQAREMTLVATRLLGKAHPSHQERSHSAAQALSGG